MEDQENEVPEELKFKIWGTVLSEGYGAWLFVGGFLVLVGLAAWIF